MAYTSGLSFATREKPSSSKMNQIIDNITYLYDQLTGSSPLSGVDIDSGSIDGTTIGASVAAAGTFTTITGSGDVAIDTNVLFVDVSTNRVGVNSASPSVALHVDGDIEVGVGTGAPRMTVNGAAGEDRRLWFQTNGNDRWAMGATNNTESGSNAGSDFVFAAYEDDGSFLRRDITIERETGDVGIDDSTPSYKLDVSGSVHASSFPTSSDARFKRNVQEVTGVLAKVAGLRGVTFEWNYLYRGVLGKGTAGKDKARMDRRQLGVIAQEIESSFPEAVTTWDAPEAGIIGARAVDYGRLATVVSIGGLKEVITELDAIKARLDALEA